MTSRIEASRNHGPFDPRRGARPATVTPGLQDGRAGLDWDAFSSLNFPGRSRHDLQAISAYDAYRGRG
jgi:hypothetical protein